MINLGILKEINDLRSVWQHEALNFTPWILMVKRILLLELLSLSEIIQMIVC